MPPADLGEGAAATGSSEEMPHMKAAAASSGGSPLTHGGKEEAASSRARGRRCAPGIKEVGTGTGLPAVGDHKDTEMLQKRCTKACKESASNEIVAEENIHVQAQLMIRKLNELGLGEDISNEEYIGYLPQLACMPHLVNTRVILKDEELDKQDFLHAVYRIRYYKYKLTQQVSKKALHDDKLKEGYPLNYLEEEEEIDTTTTLKEDYIKDFSEKDLSIESCEKQGFFKRFERDGTFDWFFYPDYLRIAALNDYQRLVLQNYGGCEYVEWSEYHSYLHIYKVEQEYVKYCEELSKQLKWMEDYLHLPRSSVKWGCISTRGAYQAVKIAATGFSEISRMLAYNGYYACIKSMSYDFVWFKELDGVYFEIWRRITHQTKSFKDALKDVYNLNKFPLRQPAIKGALEFDNNMNRMEKEFHTCTASITPEVNDDKALELIVEAVKKLHRKPKFYEQYIRKKIDIARTIGIPGLD